MSTKSTLVFNLGLENNPWDAKECLFLLESFGSLVQWDVVTSEYEGKPERTLVAELSCQWYPIDDVIAAIRTLAIKTTQECIAVRIDGMGAVIGSLEEYDMGFNSDYFVGL